MGKRIIGLLAGCSLLLGAGQAIAASEGIQVGPTLLFPSVAVKTTHDDNIFLNSKQPESDWVTTIAPELRLTVPVRRFYLEAEAGLAVLRYADFDDENSTNWFVGGAVGAAFPGGLDFRVSDRHTEQWLVSSQEYGPGEDFTLNTAKASIGFAVRDALRLEMSGLRNAYTYDLSADRERVESTVQGDVYWKFRPRLSAVVEAGYSQYEYDSNTAQDGTATSLGGGVTWDVTAKSTGFAKAGYQWKRYDNEDRRLGTVDDEYFFVSAGARVTFTRRTALEAELMRASHESDFPGNPYFLRTALSAALSQSLTAKLYGRVQARIARDEYPNETSYVNPYDRARGFESGERTDDWMGASVTLGFDVTRWLSLEAGYAAERRNSTFDTFDFDANRISLSARASF